MATLEEIGRKLDAELERFCQFVETEVVPTTERRTAELLRGAAERLEKLASELESRTAARATAEKR